jgi:hypothetical protein
MSLRQLCSDEVLLNPATGTTPRLFKYFLSATSCAVQVCREGVQKRRRIFYMTLALGHMGMTTTL